MNPEQSNENGPVLYRHVTMKEWGMGILAWEGPRRRRYQFQDGRMRTIGKGHYDKMVPVEAPPENARAVVAELSVGLDAARARRRLEKIDPEARRELMSLADQTLLFSHEFPGGFKGEKWLTEKRGQDVTRKLKRLRNPVLAMAAEVLSKEALDRAIASDLCMEHMDAIIEVLKRTDLVRMKDEVSRLVDLTGLERKQAIIAIRGLLYGDDRLAWRFDALITALTPLGASPPSWPLVTVFGALALPKEHVVVRPSVFRKQAQWAAPTLEHQARPHGKLYEAYVEMVQLVDRSLFRRGLEPQDLIDVYDFMVVTSRKNAKLTLDALPKE